MRRHSSDGETEEETLLMKMLRWWLGRGEVVVVPGAESSRRVNCPEADRFVMLWIRSHERGVMHHLANRTSCSHQATLSLRNLNTAYKQGRSLDYH